ncbi:MAG: arginine--tRNA ligase [Bacteroidales bacterium]
MNIEELLLEGLEKGIKSIYTTEIERSSIQLQITRKEFEGDYTALIFPLAKSIKRAPEEIAQKIGEYLLEYLPQVKSFNVVKGFLNISMNDSYWLSILKMIVASNSWGEHPSTGREVMVEFSSPNTNKPLHLGHIRNILLGWSLSNLLEANGDKVVKVNLVNDRGIHICKSMVAKKLLGPNDTPQKSDIKGDHFVGKYYVAFNDLYKKEIEKEVARGVEREVAEIEAPILKEAQEMLRKWERGESETIDLWREMNGWVYEGFDTTYRRLGVSFDQIYYESNTYLLGKELVEQGLKRGLFEQREDHSIWCDLSDDGLDNKLLLRSDGTSVYITQDLGTAHQRFTQYNLDEHIYVVGNEQIYHFQVLKLILKKMGFEWANSIYHMSYGMVELPDGKMKSREGTVVDADDLIDKMVATAAQSSNQSGKLSDMDSLEREQLFSTIALGALKYFIIKVDPKKTILFNPEESIDFNGNTGPFIQYTHARIKSILRRGEGLGYRGKLDSSPINNREREIIKLLYNYPQKIKEGAAGHSPAVIANYCYDLAKEFNQYYHETSILGESDRGILLQRLQLIETIALVLSNGMKILGIELPERM